MKILIGSYKYDLRLVNKVTEEDDEGLCDTEAKTIRLKRGQDATLSTAFHEVFHAELYEASLHCVRDWNDGIEEIIVDILSRSVARNYDKILAFLKKNKQKL